MLKNLLLLALAGALGTLARYGLSIFIVKIHGDTFPWGTLTVNLIGCFIAGLLWTIFENRIDLSPDTRLIIMVGFIGAFTTFSTYILESGQLAQTAGIMKSSANIFLQNGFGLMALFVGLSFGKLFFR